jgi:DNA-directed RNA polymerase specialized sigma24 family protein
MSIATNVHELREVEAFYKRWGSDIFVFCRLFLGDVLRAEAIVSQTFAAFYRESRALPIAGEIPSRLVGLALQAMQPCRDGPSTSPWSGSLENCILHLDCKQRSVFIARNVLGMTWSGVAIATTLSVEEVRKFWLSGMLRVRELLPRDFFDR